ncbi:TPR repeat protein [Blastomyces dermatitidis ATCC 18188]|uniref:Succinate dehydrogenase assembly factor 2, mitochondrial n=1 Tax=Ajellomyces dermatitidis (strain ATCC 18188 / CBS 674.68) TaxID=653446 RepID=F2T2B9_AJEDA|nr:TPR repeat protein [Blastomyces dermatitidis ATCC 18188]
MQTRQTDHRDDVNLGSSVILSRYKFILLHSVHLCLLSIHSSLIARLGCYRMSTLGTPQFFMRALRPSNARAVSSFFQRQAGAASHRSLSSTTFRASNLNERGHSTAPLHRETQKSKPLNPHLTNTTPTSTDDFPKVGAKSPPPDLITGADPDYQPRNAVPGKMEHMTGTSMKTDGGRKPELGVGEMEGITFKVEPLRRQGEDITTMRARLLYQSRKRGILESDLLLSTFASQHLPTMTERQLQEYDKFLDENDWDIYYWATQEAEDPSVTDGANSPSATNISDNQAQDTPTETWKSGAAKSGEWAQTVGAFKPAYRPVPQRWKDSEILAQLRQHVHEKSALGVKGAKGQSRSGGGLGQMPDLHRVNA